MRDFNKPDSMESGALKRIAVSPEGEVLKKYLLKELSSTDEDNRRAENIVFLYRGQGKALTIKAILDLLEATKK